jgi:hypothetical protein
MQRRKFIAAIASAVASTPALRVCAASAQQAAKVRRIGVLMGSSESDSGERIAAGLAGGKGGDVVTERGAA